MDPRLMLQTAVVIFAIAAAGGLLMAAIRFKGAPRPPSSIAMLHGLLAGAGLTLVLYPALTVGIPAGAWFGLLLLVAAAGGGLILNLKYHEKQLALPIWLIMTHAGIAIVGFIFLAISAWR
jgi:hypothetical protein